MSSTIAGLPILHEDEGWFALDKPSGLPVHRGYTGERRTLVDLLRREMPAGVYPVHRLDRGTSGVMLIARTPEAVRPLQEQFAEHRVRKVYLALARGVVPEDQVIDYAIPTGPEKTAPRADARTRVRCLGVIRLDNSPLYEPRYSLILAEPESGRFHQVRRHLSHTAHPLLGDSDHGRPDHNRLLRDRVGLNRLALHAAELHLYHPTSGAPLALRSPFPEDLAGPLRAMGFDLASAFAKVGVLEGISLGSGKHLSPDPLPISVGRGRQQQKSPRSSPLPCSSPSSAKTERGLGGEAAHSSSKSALSGAPGGCPGDDRGERGAGTPSVSHSILSALKPSSNGRGRGVPAFVAESQKAHEGCYQKVGFIGKTGLKFRFTGGAFSLDCGKVPGGRQEDALLFRECCGLSGSTPQSTSRAAPTAP